MTLTLSEHTKLESEMNFLKSKGVPFAMATVVRTVDATSAKPGSKALLDLDGNILMGWVVAAARVVQWAKQRVRRSKPVSPSSFLYGHRSFWKVRALSPGSCATVSVSPAMAARPKARWMSLLNQYCPCLK